MWHVVGQCGEIVDRHGVIGATSVASVPPNPRAINRSAGQGMLGVPAKTGNPVATDDVVPRYQFAPAGSLARLGL